MQFATRPHWLAFLKDVLFWKIIRLLSSVPTDKWQEVCTLQSSAYAVQSSAARTILGLVLIQHYSDVTYICFYAKTYHLIRHVSPHTLKTGPWIYTDQPGPYIQAIFCSDTRATLWSRTRPWTPNTRRSASAAWEIDWLHCKPGASAQAWETLTWNTPLLLLPPVPRTNGHVRSRSLSWCHLLWSGGALEGRPDGGNKRSS